jgi:hypothetical protein
MPYISKENRQELDESIESLRWAIVRLIAPKDRDYKIFDISSHNLLDSAGNLNYVITRLCAGLICEPSYSKIAIITGVLENVKQELYRRGASEYEDLKSKENGDIPEYVYMSKLIKNSSNSI